MTDIALIWDNSIGYADFAILNGDLVTGSDLLTSVIVSLFTDRRAPDTYQGGTGDLRGWWGDTYSPTPWGSRLWTLDRASKSGAANLLKLAQNYCTEALQWLLDDGVAASVKVATSWINSTSMRISVSITEPATNTPTVFQFAWAWTAAGSQGN